MFASFLKYFHTEVAISHVTEQRLGRNQTQAFLDFSPLSLGAYYIPGLYIMATSVNLSFSPGTWMIKVPIVSNPSHVYNS